MELLQLQYFKTIAECQHITKAASKLMISQPSLSNTLSRIENELGVQLFDRQGRNIILNNYGKIVLEHANNILRELDNIRTEIDDLEQRHNNVISIASTDSIYVKSWLPLFIQQNPDLTIHHTITTREKIETGLLNGTIDFGISPSLSDHPAFGQLQLWEDDYIVFLPLQHPLAQERLHNFIDFENEPFVALPKSENIARSIDVLSQAAGFKPNIVFEGERELLERILLPMNACIIVFKSIIHDQTELGLCQQYCGIVELRDPEAHVRVNLSWDQRRSRSAAAQRLLDYMQTNDICPWHLNEPEEVARRQCSTIFAEPLHL